jgi:hypothetical protein
MQLLDALPPGNLPKFGFSTLYSTHTNIGFVDPVLGLIPIRGVPINLVAPLAGGIAVPRYSQWASMATTFYYLQSLILISNILFFWFFFPS